MSTNNPIAPSSGGAVGFDAAPPGFFDFTGAVYGNHFDEKTGGTTWVAATGPNLVDTYGAASSVLGPSSRRVAYTSLGGLAATVTASLQITGDVTVLLAARQLARSTAAEVFVSMGGTGAAAGDNILYTIEDPSLSLQTRHEHGTATASTFNWNVTQAPDLRYVGPSWSVFWMRRNGLSRWLGYDELQSTQDTFAAPNAPSGGSLGFLTVGSFAGGGSPAQGCAYAGLGIWDSDIGYDAIQDQVKRIKQGASKL